MHNFQRFQHPTVTFFGQVQDYKYYMFTFIDDTSDMYNLVSYLIIKLSLNVDGKTSSNF